MRSRPTSPLAVLALVGLLVPGARGEVAADLPLPSGRSVLEVAVYFAESCEIEAKVKGRSALGSNACQRAMHMTSDPEWQSVRSSCTDACLPLLDRYNQAMARITMILR